MLFHRHVVVLHVREPIHHIAPPIKAGTAWRVAHREHHLASGQMQVLGNLRTGLPRSHHHYRALGQRLRVAIFRRLQLQDLLGQAFSHARHDRRVIAARGYYDLIGGEIALARCYRKSAVVQSLHAFDLCVLDYRRIDHRDEAIEIRDDFILLHKAMRIVARVRISRQRALPIRRDEAERVPALVAPGMRDGLFLDDEVIDAGLL
ncbi:hypothetical protein LMG28138_06040 [Pararobbsia alpina]|uniref:Uncharacterized protein n=1 Tax=Pararobbsia alpina TaxID=621374 RepID=A0A6S7C328_9BURK|nr:hypothetical protein LMG28138_06040 [Pararobbsia alpina]